MHQFWLASLFPASCTAYHHQTEVCWHHFSKMIENLDYLLSWVDLSCSHSAWALFVEYPHLPWKLAGYHRSAPGQGLFDFSWFDVFGQKLQVFQFYCSLWFSCRWLCSWYSCFRLWCWAPVVYMALAPCSLAADSDHLSVTLTNHSASQPIFPSSPPCSSSYSSSQTRTPSWPSSHSFSNSPPYSSVSAPSRPSCSQSGRHLNSKVCYWWFSYWFWYCPFDYKDWFW